MDAECAKIRSQREDPPARRPAGNWTLDFLDQGGVANYISLMSRKVNITTNTAAPEDEMAAMVAGRIAILRKSRGYTFDELAKRARVSKGTLVQIEQGDANPSISTLCRLASALGASVADLVSTKDKAQSAVVVAGAEQARSLWAGPNGGSGVLLAGTTGPDMLELWNGSCGDENASRPAAIVGGHANSSTSRVANSCSNSTAATHSLASVRLQSQIPTDLTLTQTPASPPSASS